MTSGAQPFSSGAPTPVQGVTGGPGLPQGVASVDGTTGNVQISPPSNTIQQKKGANPQSFQVYEFDAGTTSFARIALNAQTGGPFQLAVETAPPGLVRGLQINTNGSVFFNDLNTHFGSSVQIDSGSLVIATGGGVQLQGLGPAAAFSWTNGANVQSDTINRIVITPPTGGNQVVLLNGVAQFGNTFTTVATAGAATALPATPALYITVLDSGGTQRKIPAYNV